MRFVNEVLADSSLNRFLSHYIWLISRDSIQFIKTFSSVTPLHNCPSEKAAAEKCLKQHIADQQDSNAKITKIINSANVAVLTPIKFAKGQWGRYETVEFYGKVMIVNRDTMECVDEYPIAANDHGQTTVTCHERCSDASIGEAWSHALAGEINRSITKELVEGGWLPKYGLGLGPF